MHSWPEFMNDGGWLAGREQNERDDPLNNVIDDSHFMMLKIAAVY